MGEDSKYSWGLKMDISRRVDEFGLSSLLMFSDISDNELDNLVKDFMSRHGATTGEPILLKELPYPTESCSSIY